tara:strand:- start:1844 stop:2446 length:603 start_codon:yes stop_codon:yes gene_type:complete
MNEENEIITNPNLSEAETPTEILEPENSIVLKEELTDGTFDSNFQRPKKERTQKQKDAFEKARIKRAESIALKKEQKELNKQKRLEEKARKKLEQKAIKRGEEPTDKEVDELVEKLNTEKKAEISDDEELVVVKKKPTKSNPQRKKKKRIVYISDEETSEDEEGEDDYEIQRATQRIKEPVYHYEPPQKPTTMTSFYRFS